MKTIIVHVFDKDSSKSMSQTIRIDGQTKEQLKQVTDEFFGEIPFRKWFYEVESWDDLTEEEEEILRDLELEID